jgi:predicted HicB family RNase H-like nuclease
MGVHQATGQQGEGAMSDDPIEAALMAAFRDDAPIKEAKRRGKKEKEMRMRPDDGRRLRATGRTAQFNVNMKPEVKASIVKAAHKAGIPITVWIEQAALAYMGQAE